MKFNKITIIGLGLIGGSLAKALKETGAVGTIIGIDSDSETIDIGLRTKIIDAGFNQISKEIYYSDLVVISTYINSITEIASKLDVSDKTVVTDTGSVKGTIVDHIGNSCDFNYTGSHPIAGTEKSGVQNIVDGLFKDRLVIITPTQSSSEETINKVTEMWHLAGSRVIQMTATVHDKIFAHVSHLPHLVAFSLINAILKTDSSFYDYAGGGLKDFTRVAESSPQMWADIFMANSREILDAIKHFSDSIHNIENAITSKDKDRLIDILTQASEFKKSEN